MEYPLDISIKIEKDDLERDSNDNYEQVLLHVSSVVSVKVEKEAQIQEEQDWCIPSLGSPDDLLEPLFFKKLTEPEAEKCAICDRYFSDSNSLLKHKITHLRVLIRNPHLFQCDSCKSFFTNRRNINRHIKTQHNTKKPNNNASLTYMLSYKPKAYTPKTLPFVARYGKTYIPKSPKTVAVTREKLKDGVTNTLNYKPKSYKEGQSFKHHKCTICSKVLPYKSWHAHMKEVHGDGGYFCGLCTTDFKCQRYFLRHMKKKHMAQTQDTPARTRDTRARIQDTPVPCDECDNILQGKYALKTHKRNVHSTGEFVCKICNSKLKCKSYLLAHMKRVHYDDGKMHQCECGKTFKSPRYLRVHKKNAHSRK